jgi:hypothetical protein
MYQDSGATVVRKRMSFLTALVCSAAAVTIAIILSITGITIYGMNLIDKKTDNLAGLIQETVKALPAVRESLPPALSDAFNDERHPEYLQNLVISSKLVEEQGNQKWPRSRVVVEVQNNGNEVVTLLSLRLVALDGNGDPVREWHTWAATPLQLEDEWRGPLLPHETRRLAVWCKSSEQPAKITHEVSEVRLWIKDAAKTVTNPGKQAQEPPSSSAT